RRLHFVVDEHGCTVAQLEHARASDLFARLDTGNHCDLIATRRPKLHELLAHSAIRLTVGIFEIGDNKYGITEGDVADRGRRQSHNWTVLCEQNLRLNKHAGTQAPAGIGQCGLNLNVSSRLIYDRVNGRHSSHERRTRDVSVVTRKPWPTRTCRASCCGT